MLTLFGFLLLNLFDMCYAVHGWRRQRVGSSLGCPCEALPLYASLVRLPLGSQDLERCRRKWAEGYSACMQSGELGHWRRICLRPYDWQPRL